MPSLQKLIRIAGFKTILVLIVFTQYEAACSQTADISEYCISADELKLLEQLNQIREDYDLKILQLSVSLSYVARLHVEDLYHNHPDTSICGFSSWSDKGNWKACCYNSYVLDEDCMWAKPREITSYPYRGYEMVTYFEDDFTNDSIIDIWTGTKEVLDMILTKGSYSSKEWACMGIGVYENYVSLWFGQRNDPAGVPPTCNTQTAGIEESGIVKGESGSFYLIFGSFEDKNDAKEALRRLNKEDFPEAGILSTGGQNRIYIGKFGSLKAAMHAKQNLPYSYREAWILKD